MHLIAFSSTRQDCIGTLDQLRNQVVDLSIAASDLPGNRPDFISQGSAVQERTHTSPLRVLAPLHLMTSTFRLPFQDLDIMSTILEKRVSTFRNYKVAAQSLSTADKIPTWTPIFFTRATTSVIGSNSLIPALQNPTSLTDLEGELVVITGIVGRAIEYAVICQYEWHRHRPDGDYIILALHRNQAGL